MPKWILYFATGQPPPTPPPDDPPPEGEGLDNPEDEQGGDESGD